MTVDHASITFVVQGPIYPSVTRKVLESIREHCPKATIILSTWKNSNLDQLTFDQVLLCDDPGAWPISLHRPVPLNNINRQIVSTFTGLSQVKTKFAFKIRTDFILTGIDFLSYWGRFPRFELDHRLTNSRIMACCYFTRNPTSIMPHPYQVSDLAFFGETRDLRSLYDVPLMTVGDAHAELTNGMHRFTPEQHLFINNLQKKGRAVNCEYMTDANAININDTEKYLASNFILLNFEQFNLQPTKKTFDPIKDPFGFVSCYTHHEWQELYKKHCDPQLELEPHDAERHNIARIHASYIKYKPMVNLLSLAIFIPSLRRETRARMMKYLICRSMR